MSYNKQIPLPDFRAKLLANPVKVYGNLIKTGEENIPEQLAVMKREIAEKKLLEYQIKTKKGNINEFLLNKYSDGNYNMAIIDGYDNSKNRLENGISYEYHVYWPKKEEFNSIRPHKEYWMSNEILDLKNGDSYYYHLPIYINQDKDAFTEYKTDLEGEIINTNGQSFSRNGLVYALSELKKLIESKGQTSFPALAESILRRHGFTREDGKIKLDVENNLPVEKYLKSIKNESKHNALIYLNKEFSATDNKEAIEDYDLETEKIPLEGPRLEKKLRELRIQLEKKFDNLITDKEVDYSKVKLDLVNEAIEGFEEVKTRFKDVEKYIEEFEEISKGVIAETTQKYKENKAAIDKLYDEIDTENQLKRNYKETDLTIVENNIKAELESIRLKEEKEAEDRRLQQEAEDKAKKEKLEKEALEKKKTEEEELRKSNIIEIKKLINEIKKLDGEFYDSNRKIKWKKDVEFTKFEDKIDELNEDDISLEDSKKFLEEVRELKMDLETTIEEFKKKKEDEEKWTFKVLTSTEEITEGFTDTPDLIYDLDLRSDSTKKKSSSPQFYNFYFFIANQTFISLLQLRVASRIKMTVDEINLMTNTLFKHSESLKYKTKVYNSPDAYKLMKKIREFAGEKSSQIRKFDQFLIDEGQKSKTLPIGYEIVNP